MPQTYRTLLKSLHDQGAIEPFAWHFADAIAKTAPDGSSTMPDQLFLAAALVAQNTVVHKHVCLKLTSDLRMRNFLAGDNFSDETVTDIELPADLTDYLKSSVCSFAVEDGTGRDFKPLVLEGNRLYMQRYWVYENLCAQYLNSRTDKDDKDPPDESSIRGLTLLDLDADQIAAIRQAVSSKLCVITGSPGTGKTTIIGVVLAFLFQKKSDIKVCLCAPTGKAQARLKEALDAEIENNLALPADAPARISLQNLSPLTIHRLLKINPVTGQCGHHKDKPLLADVLVVDEVSMVDLPLLVKLLSAVQKECSIILLGDKDQLAAVETGAALVEMCEAWQNRAPVARLTHSHRFSSESGIGQLKECINHGAGREAWEILVSGDGALSHAPAPTSYEACAQALKEYLAGHPFCEYLQAQTASEALRLFDRLRILCATRHGPCGVNTVNLCVQKLLGVNTYGHGYPVMVTVNDYARHLFNGDIGICLKDPNNETVRVWFPSLEKPGEYRSFGIAELPGHTPVFAMTVHKSQGSGFGEVLLILPQQDNPVLTRELIYTGITRARTKCVIWADRAIFEKCVRTPTRRMSGLKDKLKRCSGVCLVNPD
ncbi:MAG: exodeoxyribonuclease V subunit alpha [Kiritimatiellae bacterium]|nr:exodeoxyribonuclease V subunit alpha [Kiritimatiellia bacterium]